MSRVNIVHGLYDHDLRGDVRASRKTPKGIILGVFFDGEFNRESSVIPVKLAVKKDSLIKKVGSFSTARQHVREIIEHMFPSRAVRETLVRFFEPKIQKNLTRGGWS